ncbi:MAG: aspartate aminotransferase family protein [Chloroflexota bacterium]
MQKVNAAANVFTTQSLPKVAWGKGSYVYDQTGKQYIDGSGGPAVYCLGHANEEVNEAIIHQLKHIAHAYRYTFTSDPLEQLQQMVSDQCGSGLNQMMFVSGGSEAVESCLKIALQYQTAIGQRSRRRFIARERSWHGNTLGALSVSGFRQRREPFEGALMEASFVSPANVYRPPNDVDPTQLADYCAYELAQEIERLGPEQVCAFIFEPVVGAAGGVVPAPPGYAKKMRDVCDRYGVLMIADEVMCGAGRTGTWRALAHDDVMPDLMSIAKGLGGGYVPLGAAIYHDKVANAIYDVYGDVLTGHTFAGHTAACAAGVAVQKIVQRDGLVDQVASNGAWMIDQLRAELGDHPHVGDIRGRGFFIGTEFVKDRPTKAPFDPDRRIFVKFKMQAFENGLICYPVGGNVDGERGDFAILAPPYNASKTELTEIIEKFVRTCREVLPS